MRSVSLGLLAVLMSAGIVSSCARVSTVNGCPIQSNASCPGAKLQGQKFALRNADLSGAKLMNADFTGSNLSGINLSGAILTGATFGANTNLSGAKMDGAILDGATFEGADLTKASLSTSASMVGTKFNTGTKLVNATVKGNISNAEFNGVDLTNAVFSKSQISSTKFVGSTLQGTNFSGAQISCSSFTGGKYDNVDISEAIILGTSYEALGAESATENTLKCAVVVGGNFQAQTTPCFDAANVGVVAACVISVCDSVTSEASCNASDDTCSWSGSACVKK